MNISAALWSFTGYVKYAVGGTARGKRSILYTAVLFFMFMVYSFGIGYSTLSRFDPRQGGTTDTISYYQMTLGHYHGINEDHRYRVLTPTLAGLLNLGLARINFGVWDTVFLSLLIVNSVFTSITALLLMRTVRIVAPDPLVEIITPFLYLASWTVVNGHLLATVDAGEICFLTAMVLACLQRKWFYVPILLGLGVMAKETVAYFGLLCFGSWWLYSRLRRSEKDTFSIVYILLTLASSGVVYLGIRLILGELTEGQRLLPRHDQLVNFLPNLLESLLSKTMIYGYAFLFPIALLRIRRLPGNYIVASCIMGLAVFLACGYVGHVGSNVARPLFNTIGPILTISCAIFLRDIVQYRSTITQQTVYPTPVPRIFSRAEDTVVWRGYEKYPYIHDWPGSMPMPKVDIRPFVKLPLQHTADQDSARD